MSRHNDTERYAEADCAINLDPSEDELVEIACETGAYSHLFRIYPRVAILSFSTYGSGKGASVDKMRGAAEKLQATNIDYAVNSELQFDAALCRRLAS